MIPRLGSAPRPGTAYRLRPGAYAILLDGQGRVLLTEQTTPETVETQLPGGGIDPGESPLPALLREVREETGHSARILRHLGSYRRFTFMSEYGFHAEKLCHVYLGRAGVRHGPPEEPGHRVVWAKDARHAAGLVESPGDASFLDRLARMTATL